jgi:hypothetical protein
MAAGYEHGRVYRRRQVQKEFDKKTNAVFVKADSTLTRNLNNPTTICSVNTIPLPVPPTEKQSHTPPIPPSSMFHKHKLHPVSSDLAVVSSKMQLSLIYDLT